MNNAWNINNNEEMLFSPNRTRRIVFCNMSEFGMGSPLHGDCLILEQDGSAIYISGDCGCPAVWSKDGRYMAVPFGGRSQRLAVADLELMELRLSVNTYSVLELSHFEGKTIIESTRPFRPRLDIDSSLWLCKRPLHRISWPYFMFDHIIDTSTAPYSEEDKMRSALRKQNKATGESASIWIEKLLNDDEATCGPVSVWIEKLLNDTGAK